MLEHGATKDFFAIVQRLSQTPAGREALRALRMETAMLTQEVLNFAPQYREYMDFLKTVLDLTNM